MSNRYYAKFPAAPVDLIAALAAGAGIPTIVDVRVSADNSVFIDIAQQADEVDGFRLTGQHLADIAEVCGIELKDLYVESLPDGENCELVTVTAWATPFDFSKLFKGTAYEGSICNPRAEAMAEAFEGAIKAMEQIKHLLPGVEDSEEMIEATEAVIKAKSDEPKAK